MQMVTGGLTKETSGQLTPSNGLTWIWTDMETTICMMLIINNITLIREEMHSLMTQLNGTIPMETVMETTLQITLGLTLDQWSGLEN